MLCFACHRFTTNRLLCDHCRRQMRPAPDRIVAGGVPVHAAFTHTGPARALVHHLKYRGHAGYADLVADLLAPRLPPLPLVPVPRAISRRVRYGIDPAGVIADRLAYRLDVPVLQVIRPSIHTRRRAGGDHNRPVSPFALRRLPPGPVLLVDDVLTTGGTMEEAIAALIPSRVAAAVVANAVPGVSSLRRLEPTTSPNTTGNE